MQKKQEILDTLYSLQRFGIIPGLERTYNMLSDFGDPHHQFPSIHVAGTNGKGFTCSAIASVLMEAGYKVGLYTSPHIKDFNERVIINGRIISDDDIINLAELLIPYSEKINATFFEITTAMAFIYFAQQNVDIAIIETGMGGRFDSTNVLKPLVSIITDIGLEHQEYLGDTLKKIAYEKAGIIKETIPLVISKRQKEVLPVFIDKANEMQSPIHYAEDISNVKVVCYNKDFTMNIDIEEYQATNIKIPVGGSHQIKNLQLALAALHIAKGEFGFSKEHIVTGLQSIRKNTYYHCRLELVERNPVLVEPLQNHKNIPPQPSLINKGRGKTLNYLRLEASSFFIESSRTLGKNEEEDDLLQFYNGIVLIDTAHNPQAIKALSDTLKQHGHSEAKWNILYAAMSDKDVKSILSILKPHCKTLIITEPTTSRAMPTEEIADIAKELKYSSILQNKNSKAAFSEFLKQGDPILVCGSFFLAGEIY